MKQIYLFNIVASNYRKKIGFPVCPKENFTGLQAYRKSGKSARASPTPHHTLNEERSARFTAQPLSSLVLAVCPRFLTSVCRVFSFFVSYAYFAPRCLVFVLPSFIHAESVHEFALLACCYSWWVFKVRIVINGCILMSQLFFGLCFRCCF